MALNIPLSELGGDQQIVGVYATTSRRESRCCRTVCRNQQFFGDWVQVARQGNPLFNEGLVALEDKDSLQPDQPDRDQKLFRKYARNPELAKLLNLLVLEPDPPASRPIAPTSRAFSSLT